MTTITIRGSGYPMEDLQQDVAARKRKGYGESFAFSLHTVQGLINKIEELQSLSSSLRNDRLNFSQAFADLKDGKKICREIMPQGAFIRLADFHGYSEMMLETPVPDVLTSRLPNGNYGRLFFFTFSDVEATDWYIV